MKSKPIPWQTRDVTPKVDWVSEHRLRPYVEAALEDNEKAYELYMIDRSLSASLFCDISYVEVALRNAINRALSETFGVDWYALVSVGFDARVRENLTDAWESLPTKYTGKGVVRDAKLGGRIVAASMLRTWTNILDAGGTTGLEKPFERSAHEKIWEEATLLKAFPGARILARSQDENFEHTGLTRAWVHKKVHPVRIIRNRIAHHESLIRGIPLTGEGKRLSPRDSFNAILDVAFMLDSDLQSFILSQSRTPLHLNELEEKLGDYPTV